MARRQHLTLTVLLSIVAFFTLTYMLSDNGRTDRRPSWPPASSRPKTGNSLAGESLDTGGFDMGLSEKVLTGGTIAPKLENATAKAELGRATWKFLHTMMARFPDKPTEDDSLALKSFIHLFARLYPCGQCAEHFQKMLKQFPPQVSSRTAAAGWACFVHNEVNTRLHKPQFDCSKIGDFYDCGCGDDDKKKGQKTEEGSGAGGAAAGAGAGAESGSAAEGKEKVKGSDDDKKDSKAGQHEKRMEGPSITVVKEGLTRGG